MTEMVHPPHLGDAHQRDYAGHGCQDIVFRRVIPSSRPGADVEIYIDCEPEAIMCSAELIDQLRHAPNEYTHVRDGWLRIIVTNADLTYRLDRAACGCWLGRRETASRR